MQRSLFITLVFGALIVNSGKCQDLDTLVDVGGYHLHFHIIKGNGTPILFESGSGADVTVWDTILKPLADVTHTTLITYDRAGFGKSELDSSNEDINKHGILNGIEGLEAGLKKLGYDGNIILVASSFGGFCATLYAARHQTTVKALVGVDMNHVSWFTDSFVNAEMIERKRDAEIIKSRGLAIFYQQLNLQNTIDLMRKTPFPPTVPAIDLVSQFNFPDSLYSARWRECHRQFAAAQPNREGIFANECGHIIFRDNPLLVISAIVKAYAGTLNREQNDEMIKRLLSYNLVAANDARREELQYRHSMDDLVSWGNALLQKNEKEKAIEGFKLNVFFNLENADAFENLAQAYESAGNKELAIENYKHSLQLNPGNTNAKDHLKKLLP